MELSYNQMMLYDLIEERGLGYVIRNIPLEERQEYLYETPDEELVMYFVIGLSTKTLLKLFGETVVKQVLSERLPSENLFYTLTGMDDINRLYTKRGFEGIFVNLSSEQFLQECMINAVSVVKAVEKGLISRDKFIGKIKYFRLDQICKLKKFHSRFHDFLGPLYQMILYSIFPTRSGSGFRDQGFCDKRRESARRSFNLDISKQILSFI